MTRVGRAMITELRLGSEGRWLATIEVDGKSDARVMAFHIGESVTFTIESWEAAPRRHDDAVMAMAVADMPGVSTPAPSDPPPAPSGAASLQVLIREAHAHLGRSAAAVSRVVSKHAGTIIRSQQVGTWRNGSKPVPEKYRAAIEAAHTEIMAGPPGNPKPTSKPGPPPLPDEERDLRRATVQQVIEARFKRRRDLARVLSGMEGAKLTEQSVGNWVLGRAPVPDRWWAHVQTLAAGAASRAAAALDPAAAPPSRRAAVEKASAPPPATDAPPDPADAPTVQPGAKVQEDPGWGGAPRRVSRAGLKMAPDSYPETLRMRDEMASALSLVVRPGPAAVGRIGRRNAIRIVCAFRAHQAGSAAPADGYDAVAGEVRLDRSVVAGMCRGETISDQRWAGVVQPLAKSVLADLEALHPKE